MLMIGEAKSTALCSWTHPVAWRTRLNFVRDEREVCRAGPVGSDSPLPRANLRAVRPAPRHTGAGSLP